MTTRVHSQLMSRALVLSTLAGMPGVASAMRPPAHPGRLVIVGGALAATNESVYRAILDARLGRGPLCVFPTAGATPETAMDGPVAIFDKFGGAGTAKGVLVSMAKPETARDPAVVAQIRSCSGFFFIGGVQSRVIAAFRPDGKATPAYDALMARWREGAVVSGSSAGAAIMSDPMIAGGTSAGAMTRGVRRVQVAADSDDTPGGVAIAPGLGFFSAALADQHFLSRGRFGRLLVALLDLDSFDLAFGIDENTALVVDGATLSVAGASGVVVMDERGSRRTGRSVNGVRVELLGAGDRFDLATRRVTLSTDKQPLAAAPPDGATVPAPADAFARWELLHVLERFARSPMRVLDLPMDAGTITLRKAATFRAVSRPGAGVQGAPAGLAMTGLQFDLRREQPRPPLSSIAPPARFTDPDRLKKLSAAFPEIDRVMHDFAERAHVPGIAYGIIVDGRLVHAGTSGLRDIAARAPVDTSTVFRIASMTKSFTALSILKLRDEGKLSLDDPAERYIPELAGLTYPTRDAPKITIRHLLSHSAGFPEDNPWGDQQLADTDDEMSRMMRRGIPFSNAPGLSYEYSNYGFAILGRIVAKVSGMPYAQYVTTRVLQPLGMTETRMQAATVPANRLAHGYRRQDDQWLEEQQLPDGAFGSMGGMLTSIGDLGRWVGFMLDAWPPRDDPERGTVRRASVREMQQVVRYNGGTAVVDSGTHRPSLSAGGYGFGLGIRQTCLFRISVTHTGGLPGFGSLMRWLPEQGVGIIALGNLTYTGWSGVADRSLDILARTGGLVAREPQPAPVLATRQDQVTRLVLRWSDALADSVAAMNLFLDQSKERRRAAIERVRLAAGDDCRPEGGIVAENALRGRWRLRCRSGDLRVSITLAPTEPAGAQFLDVSPIARDESLAAGPVCR